MNWEEYENSDWYREAHPERFERKANRELYYKEGEMRSYLDDVDWYRKEGNKQDDEDTANGKIVKYVVTKLWNCRVRGIVKVGDYETCRIAQMERNIALFGSEWESAGIERIVADDEDDLDETLQGYYECEFDYNDYEDY